MSALPCRVLVVDDEAGIRRIFALAIANYGFVVDCAESSSGALRMLERETYDVIVSDVHMPSGDGIDFLGLVRERGVHTPVIVMSGRPSADGKARALARGAFRYMVKPVMPSELRQVIESAVAVATGLDFLSISPPAAQPWRPTRRP
jgi:DNA-binding NtrC family response regulator